MKTRYKSNDKEGGTRRARRKHNIVLLTRCVEPVQNLLSRLLSVKRHANTHIDFDLRILACGTVAVSVAKRLSLDLVERLCDLGVQVLTGTYPSLSIRSATRVIHVRGINESGKVVLLQGIQQSVIVVSTDHSTRHTAYSSDELTDFRNRCVFAVLVIE